MKRLLQLVFLALITPFAWSNDLSAQSTGFESGNLSGWTASGADVAVVGTTSVSPGGGKNWTVTPYGSQMAQLFPSGGVQFNTATTQLGLNSAENTAIRQFMSANAGGGNPNPTNASWIRRTVELQAGTAYSFSWNYVSTDYTPFNDGSMMTLTHSSNASIMPTLNNSVQRYALLGFTNPGTGNYSTGSYGSTGWQLATFTVPASGSYVLGFASFNLGDTALSPMLFIDELQGNTSLNGQSFGPIAPNSGSTAPATPVAPPPPPPGPTVTGGTITQTNAPSTQIIQSGSGYTNNADRPSQQTRINTWTNTAAPHSNTVDIDQVSGTNNSITVSASGSKNRVELSLGGVGANTVNLTQIGSNYINANVIGHQNNLTSSQTNTASTNYAETTISGNNNTVNHTQSNSQLLFSTVGGNSNTLVTSQSGTGQHYLDVKMTGNGHNVNVNQFGSIANNARIDVTNAGGAATVDLDQGGGKNFTLIQSCGVAAGCNTIVNQQ